MPGPEVAAVLAQRPADRSLQNAHPLPLGVEGVSGLAVVTGRAPQLLLGLRGLSARLLRGPCLCLLALPHENPEARPAAEGAAKPAPVAQTFFVDADVRSRTKLDAIVTVVDAKHVRQQLKDAPEAAEQIAFIPPGVRT